MREVFLRPQRPGDDARIAALQKRTLMLGQPPPQPIADLDEYLSLFRSYYVTQEPDATAIVVDRQGRTVGYMLGATDGEACDHWTRRAALKLAARWAGRWPSYDAYTRRFYALRLRDAYEVVRRPTGAGVPAHLHWNLLPTARGWAWREILRHFAGYVRSRGQSAFYGEMAVEDRRKDGSFLNWVGFRCVGSAPHHTLTALLGRPIWRVTVLLKIEDLVC